MVETNEFIVWFRGIIESVNFSVSSFLVYQLLDLWIQDSTSISLVLCCVESWELNSLKAQRKYLVCVVEV